MKAFYICVAIICLSFPAFSQYEKENYSTTDVFRINLISPGVSYEKSLTNISTLYARAYFSTTFAFSYSSSQGSDFKIYLDPALQGQLRFYYNGRKRAEAGHRVAMNSMEYITPIYDISYSKSPAANDYLEESSRRFIHKYGIGWGIQRNLKNKLSIDVTLGPGIQMAKGTYYDNGAYITHTKTRFVVMGGLVLGIWLKKKELQ